VTCVTHAGVMKALTLLAQGVHQPSDAAQWPSVHVAYGEALDIELTQGLESPLKIQANLRWL